MNKKTLSIMNAVTFVLMIIVNVISTIGLFGVTPVKEISDEYTNLLVPMGYTFSVIWTAIYIGLLYYTTKELVRKEDKYNIGRLYMISNILNLLWIISFTYRLYLISCIIIVGLLITLYIIQSQIYDMNLTKIIFSVYTAWILVASIVNITTYLISLNLIGFDSILMKTISVLMILVSLAIVALNNNNLAMKLTYIFSLVGIAVNHIVNFRFAYLDMIIIIGAVIGYVTYTILIKIFKNKVEVIGNEAI